MALFPEKLYKRIEQRVVNNSLRTLSTCNDEDVDFSSNDYLGLSKSEEVYDEANTILKEYVGVQNGATGSRLLSGNHVLYEKLENYLCAFHNSEAALVFNSGYDANIGFFSSVPQRGDIIVYDELIHASIRDGIQMSNAKAYKFKHNDIEDLIRKCKVERARLPKDANIYIVTESVFSMDGDSPDLLAITGLAEKYNAYLVVDEAHAVGVFGAKGEGLIQQLGIQYKVFARLVTFGKAIGCHGAAILGPELLKTYLVNFSRSLIYTTALSPHTIATVMAAYQSLNEAGRKLLQQNILYFKNEVWTLNEGDPAVRLLFIDSNSAIQCCLLPGNDVVKNAAEELQTHGFNVKPILSPTVPVGEERLRFCIHNYNSRAEISEVLSLLSTFVRS